MLVGSNVHAAAYDAFLKIEGPEVKGEARAGGHEGEIEILSFSWGASNPGALGRHMGSDDDGDTVLTTFDISKRSDKATPKLFQKCTTGHTFRGSEDGEAPIRLIMRYTSDAGESVDMLSIELQDSQIARFNTRIEPTSRGGGDDRPMETVSFTFSQVKVVYSSQSDDGGYNGVNADDAVAAYVDNPASRRD